MACKDKCCCPVKRRPAKKRKSTVGKVSATQLLAQSIASLALPRKVNEPFLYGNSPLGEAQRFYKPEPIVGPAVAVAPSPAVVKPEIVKPAKYSRQQIQPLPARAEQLMEEPKGRFTERTQFFNTIGKSSNVATPIENVISKPVKERKSYSSMTDDVSKPAEQSSALTNQYFTGTILERTPQELPTLRNLNDDKFFKELTTLQKVPARAEQLMEEPKGRFAERTQFFNTIGKSSNVATPIENVSKPSASERKSYKSMTDFKPVEQLNTISGSRGTLLERTPQELPTLRNLNDDKFFKELTTRQKYAMPSITNTFNPTSKPETFKQIIKSPIVSLPKKIFIPSLSSIKENVLYGTKSGTNELIPIAGGGAGMGGRPKKVEKEII